MSAERFAQRVSNKLRFAAVALIAGLTVGCGAGALNKILDAIPTPHTVGGTVTGLSGSGLVLQNNGGDDLTIGANGPFTFATPLASGAYAVTVKTQPTNPPQSCAIANGSGTIGSSNITNVTVDCSLTAVATAVGVAVGAPSSQSIDASGGSIVSPDGRLTVTIPAGSVSAATTFTIQPVTNATPGGIGSAYRLGPDAQTFNAPIQLDFHYAAQDLNGTVAPALKVAYQDSQNYWNAYKSVTLDTTAQTVTVSTTHFSDWSLLAGTQLSPAAARLGVGQPLVLTLLDCQPVDIGDLVITLLAKCEAQSAQLILDWTVNSVVGGTSATGTVVQSGASASATYTAPSAVPAANPVAVSVESTISLPPVAGNEFYVANITIDDCSTTRPCTWTGTSTAANPGLSATAQVTWQLSANQDPDLNIVLYVPESGSVTMTDLTPECTLSGNAQPIDLAATVPPSGLIINYHTSPPTYTGNGTNPVGWIETCPPPSLPEKKGAIWFLAATPQPVSADGTTLSGSSSVGGITSTWSFTKN